jgi:hypothetical protein
VIITGYQAPSLSDSCATTLLPAVPMAAAFSSSTLSRDPGTLSDQVVFTRPHPISFVFARNCHFPQRRHSVTSIIVIILRFWSDLLFGRIDGSDHSFASCDPLPKIGISVVDRIGTRLGRRALSLGDVGMTALVLSSLPSMD